MTTSKLQLKALRWPHVLGLASAGLLSFIVAASFRPWASSGTGDEDNIVMPVARADKATRPSAGTQANPSSLRNVHDTSNVELPIGAEPMKNRVIQNPFGDLNLMARADQDDLPTMPTVPAAPAPEKKRKAKTVLPPLPPPVQVAAPLPIPAPLPATAPPIPFTVAGAIQGKQIAEGHPVAFLRQHDEILVVRSGDLIGQSYRVENITAERIEFIYLPLKQRQTLSLTP